MFVHHNTALPDLSKLHVLFEKLQNKYIIVYYFSDDSQ